MVLRCLRLFFIDIVCLLMMTAGATAAGPENSTGICGKSFFIFGSSAGDMPIYNDIFVFAPDGAFVMEKLAAYGTGSFFVFRSEMVYLRFATRPGVDLERFEGIGIPIAGPTGDLLVGVGGFTIGDENNPTLFIGIELFKNQ